MAVTEQQFDQYLDMMRTAIRDGSLGGGGGGSNSDNTTNISDQRKETRTRAEDIKFRAAQQKMLDDNTKLLSHANKSLNRFSDDLDLQSSLLSKSFQDAAEALDYDNLKLVPEALQRELRNSPIFSRTNITNLEDAFKFFDDISDKRELIGAIDDYLINGATAAGDSLEKLNKYSAKTGKTLNEIAASRGRLNREIIAGTKAQNELNSQMRGGIFENLGGKATKLKSDFEKLSTKVRAVTDVIIQTMSPAMKFGTNISDSITSFMAGMNPQEMAQHVATYRQSIRAAGMSIDDFRSITEKGATGLDGYTGDLKDAVKLQASAFEAARRMGIDNANMGAFMNQQVETFKKLNSVFSITADEFMSMNKSIRDSSEINAHMYRLNQKQRAQAHLEIQQTVVRLRTMGLMQAQAMKVVDAMSAIAAKSPKERLKQAAKLQAVGGAMGFGNEAGQAASIMRRGFSQSGDKERFIELQQGMQKSVGQFMGKGLPQEMMAAQMLQTTQLQDLLGPKSAFSTLNTEQFQATERAEKLHETRNQLASQTLGWIQRIYAFGNGPLLKGIIAIVGGITALTVAIIGKSFLKGAIGTMLGGGGGAGGVMKKVIMGAVRMLGVGGLIAGITMFAIKAVAADRKPEEGEFKWWWEKTEDAEKKRQEATKKYIEHKAKESKIIVDNIVDGLKDKIPSITEEGRTSIAGMGSMHYQGALRKKAELIGIGAKGKVMSKKAFNAKTVPDQLRLTLTDIIDTITESLKTERATMITNAKNETAAQQTERGELIKKMDENIKTLTNELSTLNKPEEAILKEIKKGNDDRGEEHKEKMNADKRNTKIIWARTAPAGQ